MPYDPELYRLAERKGWALPAPTNSLPAEMWNNYWRQMRDYERDPSKGRPVRPHRTGRGR